MKHSKKAVKTLSYIAGILAVISSLTVTILLIMSAVGLFFPRKEKIILHTESLEKVYDESPISCTEPTVIFGRLHIGHELVTMKYNQFTKVGEYTNEVTYMIVDASGDDVTDMYEIEHDFGQIVIHGIPITVRSESKSKIYDGKTLSSDPFEISRGRLLVGHRLETDAPTSITEPGEVQVLPKYTILNAQGMDVTDQYSIEDDMGTLTVSPIQLQVDTGSKEKVYDGKALSDENWKPVHTPLLAGHTLSLKNFTTVTEAGEYPNNATPIVTDDKGNDVTRFYDVQINCGLLKIAPISLQISTGSITKEYDGTAISCNEYTVNKGKLIAGDRITVASVTQIVNATSVPNHLTFQILDQNNVDVTHRYEIDLIPGQLEITPRAITIRTGSATKQYDGEPLMCESYEIIKGELCRDESIIAAFTSLINIGYTQNYIIDCTIQKVDSTGNVINVTANYTITYDYGMLKITAS